MSNRRAKPLEVQATREAVKALALIHGQTRAAQISGVNLNTVKSWAKRYRWHTQETCPKGAQKADRLASPNRGKKTVSSPTPNSLQPIETIGESYRSKLKSLQSATHLNLARYNLSASKSALNRRDKLRITQEAKHLSEIHKNLFPPETEKQSSLLQIGILIGNEKPERVEQVLDS